MHAGGAGKFAKQRFEVIAAVTVEQQEFSDAAFFKRLHEVGDDPEQRGRIDVHRQRELLQVGLGAVRDGW